MGSGDVTEELKSAGQRGPFVCLPWPACYASGVYAATSVITVTTPPPALGC